MDRIGILKLHLIHEWGRSANQGRRGLCIIKSLPFGKPG
jgi:hypothetical protein